MNEIKFSKKRKEVLDNLKLTPVKIMQSRNHWEVIRCLNEEKQDLALKILKQPKRRNKLQKEITILKQARPQKPLCFPRIIDWGDDYILTSFETAPHIGFSDIDNTRIELIVEALCNLQRLSLNDIKKSVAWDPGFKRLYSRWMYFWLAYLTPEYLSLSQAVKCIDIVNSTKSRLDSCTEISHRAFGMENLLFNLDGRYLTLIDFEDFVLKDNFLYDVLYLASHPHTAFGDWTWQKILLHRYLSEKKKEKKCVVSDETIAINMRPILILITLQHMGMRRIIDEKNRLFQKMSVLYLPSRVVLKALRRLRILKTLELSEAMGIRKRNLETLLCEDTFKKVARDIIGT